MDESIIQADNLMHEGKSSLAVTIIKDVLKEAPDDAYAHYLLGIARMKCGRFFLAKEALEKANQLLPHHADNLRSLGWVKTITGEIDAGRQDLREAIQLDLMNPLAYIDLGMSYIHCFEFAEGMEWLERGRALAPGDPFVNDTITAAQKMRKEFLAYPPEKQEQLRRESRDPRTQLAFRMSALERYSFGQPLTRDEAEEVREEAKRNGFTASLIREEEEKGIVSAPHKEKSAKVQDIMRRRKEIERELARLLKKTQGPYTVEHIKDIIYHERSQDDLSAILEMLPQSKNAEELESILMLINDAWNYFPHKILDGLCPMEKILEYREAVRIKNQKRKRNKR